MTYSLWYGGGSIYNDVLKYAYIRIIHQSIYFIESKNHRKYERWLISTIFINWILGLTIGWCWWQCRWPHRSNPIIETTGIDKYVCPNDQVYISIKSGFRMKDKISRYIGLCLVQELVNIFISCTQVQIIWRDPGHHRQ